jgi:hypothetical protein
MTTRAWLVLVATLLGLALPLFVDAASFLYSWKATSDPSVIAYGVYQRIGDSDYVKIDVVEIKDLKDPNRPSYLFAGLTDGNTYWFAVTLIYLSGAESGLFNQTCIRVNGHLEDCNDDDDNGATVYITCFIRTAGEWFVQKTSE